MQGLVPGSGGSAAGPRLLARLAVLFSRQMAAAGLGEGGRFEEATEASSSRPPQPRPKPKRLAVAFSGGPDSAALGMLAGWWAGTAQPPFAAVEESLRAEKERAALRAASPPPPLPLSLALERWWREQGHRETDRASFSASCVERESEKEEDGAERAERAEEEGEGERGEERKPLALVVDHGLRPGSRETALKAAALARSLGLDPLVLNASWPPEEEGEGGEGKNRKKRRTLGAARDARFAALLLSASAAGRSSASSSSISALLVGHHADDQAETVALRLLRASGPAGLSGISPSSWLKLPALSSSAAAETAPSPPPLLLCLRPLLPVPKATLLQALDAAGARGWERDPSNGDLRAPRNRLRQLFAGAAAEEAARGAREAAAAPSPPLLTRTQKLESRRAAAAASRIASALRARRQSVEGQAARALEASKLTFELPSSSPQPHFQLRLAPLVSAGEAAGKVALAAVLDAAAAAETKKATTSSFSSSSEAAAARLWTSVSENEGRLRGALTGARCVVRPVTGSRGKELIIRSVESDERDRGMRREEERKRKT